MLHVMMSPGSHSREETVRPYFAELQRGFPDGLVLYKESRQQTQGGGDKHLTPTWCYT